MLPPASEGMWGEPEAPPQSSLVTRMVRPRMVDLVRELVASVDDNDWTHTLMELLQSQSYNQVQVDLFELMCKVCAEKKNENY